MNLITRAQLAQQAGVSKSAVSQAVKGKLRPACVGEGHGLKINLDHPAARDYIARAEAGDKPAGKRPGELHGQKPTYDVPSFDIPGDDEDIPDLEDLTVKQVALRYGGIGKFKDYVASLKNIAEYKNRELLARQRRGDLIEREAVGSALLFIVDSSFKRLVGELPGSVMQQLVPLILSAGEDSRKEAEVLLGESISRILKSCKSELVKKLQEGKK